MGLWDSIAMWMSSCAPRGSAVADRGRNRFLWRRDPAPAQATGWGSQKPAVFFWVRVEGAVGVVMECAVPSASPGHMDACGAGVPALNYLSAPNLHADLKKTKLSFVKLQMGYGLCTSSVLVNPS